VEGHLACGKFTPETRLTKISRQMDGNFFDMNHEVGGKHKTSGTLVQVCPENTMGMTCQYCEFFKNIFHMFIVVFVALLTISLCARHALGRCLLFHLGHGDGEATRLVTIATMEQQQQQQ
jgi:hypothetical protein